MDPLTHLLITRKIVGNDAKIVFAGLFPDLPFYLTYPTWIIRRGLFNEAIKSNVWPEAPKWMLVLHYTVHSLPLVLSTSIIGRLLVGTWPRWTIAWGLHILIDIPTHSRRNWAPQFLWPLSTYTFDGVAWTTLLLALIRRLYR
jgi:hypothetical protein